jgi:hypothetical protein
VKNEIDKPCPGYHSKACLTKQNLTPCSFELISHDTIFFSQNKSVNNTFNHDLSAKQNDAMIFCSRTDGTVLFVEQAVN